MWWYAVVFIGAFYASYSMMPSPENARPAGFGDVTLPTAEVGREIPVLFGERDLEGPNIVWYNDFRAVPIKKSTGGK